jgi:hypothetical protein
LFPKFYTLKMIGRIVFVGQGQNPLEGFGQSTEIDEGESVAATFSCSLGPRGFGRSAWLIRYLIAHRLLAIYY